ncbi:MAG: DNA polymerase I [Proteobacteria bacterium]|nr:DNA polymerase I [Pseudomonadota bacterium]
MKKLYLIDGSGFIFRAFHALPPLVNSEKTPVGAVYGFCNMLTKLLQIVDDNYILVVFDAARKTFRQDIYADYKAHRPPPPEDLIPQFSIIRDACDAFGVLKTELDGYEADDIIASYAESAKQQGLEVIIVSSDKDLMQLVDNGVSMLDPIKNKSINADDVLEKFGVLPNRVVDVQALAGDSSDNVPGVAGIGIKTAAELVNTYGSLEQLYQSVDLIKQPKRRESLIKCQDLAFISKQLVTLLKDIPLPHTIEALRPREDDHDLRNAFLKKHGFLSLLQRLLKKSGLSIPPPPLEENVIVEEVSFTPSKPDVIQTEDHLYRFLNDVLNHQVVAIDTETTSLNIQDAKLVGISLSIENRSAYIPIGHLFGNQLSLLKVKEALLPILEDPRILKVGHNLKYDMGILSKYGMEIHSFDDTLLLSYVLNGTKHFHNLDFLSKHYLNHETIKYEDVVGKGKTQLTFDKVNIEEAALYAAEDAQVTLNLWKLFKPKLIQNHQVTLYERAERPMVKAAYVMEREGILLKSDVLNVIEKDFKCRLEQLNDAVFKAVGKVFNIASPKQLGDVLFEDLKLPGGKKTKTGAYSTDNDILQNLCDQGFEVPKLVQEWRSISKLQSTYIDGLRESVHQRTGRIHTSFSLTGTNTGRLSSSNPNLQNIPVRSEDGKKIRKAFVAAEGYTLLSLDYSQIELRLLAHMANIEPLIKAFKNEQDIHTLTASEIFKIPLNEVTKDDRFKAKAINFGIIYGISAFGLAKQIHTSNSESAEIIQNYFSKYPGIQTFMEDQKEFARKNGYVLTLFNRKCYTQGINDKNGSIRQFAERQAINAPLQGTNADLIKMAMVDILKIIEERHLKSRMLLTVHDEILFEIHESEDDIAPKLFQKIMENITYLSVPLKVDSAKGNNWGDL